MKLKTLIISLFAFTILFTTANAQDVTYTMTQVEQFTIEGDSNVRSWAGDITDADASLVLSDVENLSAEALTPESFKSLDITIQVEGIETDSGRLTSNLQNYLKKDEHPQITFRLTEVTNISVNNDVANIEASGIINAAGVDSEVSMNVEATVSNGAIRFVGSQDLLMTSFNIDPPRAMMGTIRADDEMQILFDVTFSN